MSGNPLRNVLAEAEKDGAVVILPLKEREGRCFQWSFFSLVETWNSGMTDVTLVHGVITGYHRDRVEPGHELRIAHAWLERGDMVYESTADVMLYLPAYYRDLDAVAERSYTADEAISYHLMLSPFGPWHKTAGVFT